MGRRQRILGILACMVIVVMMGSCSLGTEPINTPTMLVEPLGEWVASCTNSDIDAESLFSDIEANAASLLRMQAQPDSAQATAIDRSTAPLRNCTPTYLEELAAMLPSAWQTSGAEILADTLSPTNNTGTASAPTDVGCESCLPTGSVEFDHPLWGHSILTTYVSPHVEYSGSTTAGYKVTDENGKVVFNKILEGLNAYALQTIGQDSNQNLYITYNPGRYPGIIVLKPTTSGLQNFGTDSFPRTYNGRFYNAVTSTESDGSYTIVLSRNDCDPSCAGGNITSTNWHYDANVDDFVQK